MTLMYGCQVTHQLDHPKYCVVMDEVGGNINTQSDGHIGGKTFLCELGVIPQEKSSRNDKHFTLLGLTLLSGEPLVYVIIFVGKRRNPVVEMEIDPRTEEVGSVLDEDYIFKSFGEGRRFPGGPACTYRGKKIPCIHQWSPKVSMTSEILKTIVYTLDILEIFDRSSGISPTLLLDGHGSRLQLLFLQYVNDPAHLWDVLIRLPYGTSLWQVGVILCEVIFASLFSL